MANPFVHVELNTTDLAKAKAFYGKLFDWKLEDMSFGDATYTMIGVGEGTGGGMMKHPMPGDDREGRYRSDGCRALQHHLGPDRGRPRAVEAQSQVSNGSAGR